MENSEQDISKVATIAPVKTLCPNCELWLVEIGVDRGDGSFFCERCEDLAKRFEQWEESLLGRANLDAPFYCRVCDQEPPELLGNWGLLR